MVVTFEVCHTATRRTMGQLDIGRNMHNRDTNAHAISEAA